MKICGKREITTGFPLNRFHGMCFTLVELLVVISIIAVLAGMLLTALNKAREKGQSILCVGNLKQNGLAFAMYAGENDGFVPLQKAAKGNTQWAAEMYSGLSASGSYTRDSLVPRIVFCPKAKTKNLGCRTMELTYGIHGNYLGSWENYFGNPFVSGENGVCAYASKKISRASEYPFLADAVRYTAEDGRTTGTHLLGSNNNGGIHFLHEQNAGILFADGHAESLRYVEVRYRVFKVPHWSYWQMNGPNQDVIYRMPNYKSNYTN